jgi:hypothetical protein
MDHGHKLAEEDLLIDDTGLQEERRQVESAWNEIFA